MPSKAENLKQMRDAVERVNKITYDISMDEEVEGDVGEAADEATRDYIASLDWDWLPEELYEKFKAMKERAKDASGDELNDEIDVMNELADAYEARKTPPMSARDILKRETGEKNSRYAEAKGEGKSRKTMPYKLRKAPNRDLYWVITKETGKKHSKEPLPKDKAKAQMAALYVALNKEQGGGLSFSKPGKKSARVAPLHMENPTIDGITRARRYKTIHSEMEDRGFPAGTPEFVEAEPAKPKNKYQRKKPGKKLAVPPSVLEEDETGGTRRARDEDEESTGSAAGGEEDETPEQFAERQAAYRRAADAQKIAKIFKERAKQPRCRDYVRKRGGARDANAWLKMSEEAWMKLKDAYPLPAEAKSSYLDYKAWADNKLKEQYNQQTATRQKVVPGYKRGTYEENQAEIAKQAEESRQRQAELEADRLAHPEKYDFVSCPFGEDGELSKWGHEQATREECKQRSDLYYQKHASASDKFFGSVVSGLTKAGDLLVGQVLPKIAPGVGSLVSEAYKTFAPPGSEYHASGRMKGGVLTRAEKKEYREIQHAMANLRESMKALRPHGTKLSSLSAEDRATYDTLKDNLDRLNTRFQELFSQELAPPHETDTMPALPKSVEETAEAPHDLASPILQFGVGSGCCGGARMTRDQLGRYVVMDGAPEKQVGAYKTAKEALEHINQIVRDNKRRSDMASRLTNPSDEGYDDEVAALFGQQLKNPSITKKLNFGSGRFSPEAYFME